MVDFQSRDTSRGVSDDEEPDEAESEEDSTEAGSDVRAEEGEEEVKGEKGEKGEEAAETGQTASDDEPHGADSAGVDPRNHGEHETHSTDHDDHGAHSHDHHHADVEHLGVAILTVSSSRTRDDDPSGDVIQELVQEADHSVVNRELVADDLDGIQRAVLALTAREDVDVVITTGGTGVTPDDVTIEAAKPLFDKELPGFGELFRIRSYESVGTRALGSRATAGISEGVPVFCLPGSEDAARLGTDELILEEAAHLVGLARRDE